MFDNTLYDFASECREAFFEMAIEENDKSILRGAYAPTMEWRSFADVLGFERLSEAIDRVHSPESILEQPPYKNAVRICRALESEGHSIKYVTTRKGDKHNATDEWLAINDFPNGELICSDENKEEHLSDCQYLIDDRPKTILNFIYDFNWTANNGATRKAFGLWFPYNQALTDVRNVLLAPTWRGIEYYLERKGLL